MDLAYSFVLIHLTGDVLYSLSVKRKEIKSKYLKLVDSKLFHLSI